MKIINKIKIFMMMVLSIVIMGNINVYTALAEENIASGIYEVANDPDYNINPFYIMILKLACLWLEVI